MSEELIGTQVIEATAPEQPVTEEHIDQPPDTAALQADIERLRKVKDEEEKRAKEAKEKAEYWRKEKARERAEYFQKRIETPSGDPKPDLLVKTPKRDDFEDYDQYVDALTDFKVARAKSTWESEIKQKEADTQFQTKMEETKQKIVQAGVAKYPDFEEVALDPTAPITMAIGEALAESDIPHDVVYYLAKNRGEAVRLARLTPYQIGREIVKIENEIRRLEAENPAKPKTVTNAPPPIKPVGSSHTVSKDLEKMTQKEYEAEMQKRTGYRY